MVKKSDKCKSLVVMDKTDYIEKAEGIVSTYEKIKSNPTMKLEEETKSLIKSTYTP